MTHAVDQEQLAPSNRLVRVEPALDGHQRILEPVDHERWHVEGGLDTHQAIARSELLLIDGMGHSLPRGVWPTVLDAIQKHVARAS